MTRYDTHDHRSGRTGPPRRRLLPFLPAAALLAAVVALSGCYDAGFLSQEQPRIGCVQQRLGNASRLYGEARHQLSRYFKERNVGALHNAYYFSSDAILWARQTRRCPQGFDDAVKSQAVELIRTSRLLRQLAQSNMRDPDPEVAQTLLQERYSDIFMNRDIE